MIIEDIHLQKYLLLKFRHKTAKANESTQTGEETGGTAGTGEVVQDGGQAGDISGYIKSNKTWILILGIIGVIIIGAIVYWVKNRKNFY